MYSSTQRVKGRPKGGSTPPTPSHQTHTHETFDSLVGIGISDAVLLCPVPRLRHGNRNCNPVHIRRVNSDLYVSGRDWRKSTDPSDDSLGVDMPHCRRDVGVRSASAELSVLKYTEQSGEHSGRFDSCPCSSSNPQNHV